MPTSQVQISWDYWVWSQSMSQLNRYSWHKWSLFFHSTEKLLLFLKLLVNFVFFFEAGSTNSPSKSRSSSISLNSAVLYQHPNSNLHLHTLIIINRISGNIAGIIFGDLTPTGHSKILAGVKFNRPWAEPSRPRSPRANTMYIGRTSFGDSSLDRQIQFSANIST